MVGEIYESHDYTLFDFIHLQNSQRHFRMIRQRPLSFPQFNLLPKAQAYAFSSQERPPIQILPTKAPRLNLRQAIPQTPSPPSIRRNVMLVSRRQVIQFVQRIERACRAAYAPLHLLTQAVAALPRSPKAAFNRIPRLHRSRSMSRNLAWSQWRDCVFRSWAGCHSLSLWA